MNIQFFKIVFTLQQSKKLQIFSVFGQCNPGPSPKIVLNYSEELYRWSMSRFPKSVARKNVGQGYKEKSKSFADSGIQRVPLFGQVMSPLEFCIFFQAKCLPTGHPPSEWYWYQLEGAYPINQPVVHSPSGDFIRAKPGFSRLLYIAAHGDLTDNNDYISD